ncbi:HAMP domain-containing histidine kinase [Paenibacillus melissococcoides]|uniref:histidine kinase n=1 Tax=Paenibacillus melissococcoides TaxID=2912268 RepID=A0ABN8UAN9_9BACL|nr:MULTISPECIES: HAMP domain-containing sensor histidine kinase [Paenibacillus]MEB9892451.1 HAMP domain-containing sensor histidine kinase [Bacillus cereus]CAH8248251.1 HAMP domain-containing histidine kinase [Paenibacillus melissococcoides]CAH8718041.1 HAMP domain-containing histidine kinase [Paenibacillus melissococcoides]CAH8719081.1 HAMP domain-containing histidine kinase [Paenibacillus melissococcoides]GIO78666.1 sensor histidine kinase YkoH [Paenibacillus dendritiformis]
MKLKNKINLYTSVLFIALILIVNAAIYYIFSSMILDSEADRVAAEAQQALAGINQAGTSIPPDDLLRAYAPLRGILQIVNADGSRGAAAAPPELKKLRDLPVAYYRQEERNIVTYQGIPHVFVSLPIVWHGGEVANLQVTESLKPTADMLNILRVVLILVSGLAILPVLISSKLLSNFITRPISSMIATMRDIQRSGQFKRIPLPKKSKDELYQMGDTFNHMMDLLEVNYEKQGQFISNASHELKTPLTIIESYASLLKRRGREQPELFDESVEAIHSEAIRMKDLTQQLLLLAKHDEMWKVTMEPIDLGYMVEDWVRAFEKAYHRDITLQREADVIIETDVQKCKQLFYIVMDNARKYSEEAIGVCIKKEGRTAVVEVSDRGIGIPAESLDKIFDRFYRVDKARTRAKGGFGLGLALAKEIADALEADIRIESIEGHGTKVRITFKEAPSRSLPGAESRPF